MDNKTLYDYLTSEQDTEDYQINFLKRKYNSLGIKFKKFDNVIGVKFDKKNQTVNIYIESTKEVRKLNKIFEKTKEEFSK